jgi:hypothetical protein
MQKTKLKALVIAALLVVGAGGGSLYVLNRHEPAKQPKAAQTAQHEWLTSSADKKTVSYEGQTGKTALETLKSLAQVKTQSSSYGDFVTSINGVAADGSKQFWSFYVNGKLASEGAGTYKTTNGQKIEWRVEDVQ